MSSSDSDDDCYGNIAQKLQKIKNKFEAKDSKDDEVVLDDTWEDENTKTKSNVDGNSSLNLTVNSTDNEEYSLDAIIANNNKRKSGRGRPKKRKSPDVDYEPEFSEPLSRRRQVRKTRSSNKRRVNTPDTSVIDLVGVEASPPGPVTSRGRGRGTRGRPRGVARASPRGRPPGRGRGRRRGTRTSSSTIHSVGNTYEYPDECVDMELFSGNNDVTIVDEVDPLEDDNEEMSVKVYWQSLDVIKFQIRKYQKFTQMFQYFAEKENVDYDKLLFMYNDKILKIDDSPESINYSIAKFIDGGIVNRNVTELVKDKKSNNSEGNGLKIKFQCQNIKKPFETSIPPEEKLGRAMNKCAEHLEIPLQRLKFYFDGDLLTRTSTPQELGLEDGECIDVKIGS
ncbi:unnamed protein product [Chrysodeixis includens]|uniref:Ubiquitin-like domain-containing protein n=1 Tax=Chrysodeixis includens TaxID=689277 RepID=A0A9P0C1U8_CHRIL|nr:unnamed protein product [Chrysodeixis includens]